jgi:hypothetical protein
VVKYANLFNVEMDNINKQTQNNLNNGTYPIPDPNSQQYPQQGNQWPVPQNQQSANTSMQQYPQAYGQPQQPAVGGALSPEMPSIVERSEQVLRPEVQVEKGKEEEKVPGKPKETPRPEAKTVEVKPDEKKFESPFNVYGYQVSQNVAQQSQKNQEGKVRGDTNSSKTWLFVLVNRLLRMYKGQEDLQTS